MKLLNENIIQTLDEHYLIETLNLNDKVLLELGCGGAVMSTKIASTGFNRKLYACEIDLVQHKKNFKKNIKNIEFILCCAQDLPFEDESIDMVLMFKSFHHIPKEHMKKALSEIKRVLKNNALLYISEPLFYGKQNELIAIFHNEEKVRIDAFEAIQNSVLNEEFKLFREIFFNSQVSYESFEDFKNKQMNLSYNETSVSSQLIAKVQSKYLEYAKDGKTDFLKPFRVDILQKVQ